MGEAANNRGLTRTITRQLFDIQSDKRELGLASLRSLDPEARLAVEQEVVADTSRDVRPTPVPTWIVAFIIPFLMARLGPNTALYQSAVLALGGIWEVSIIVGLLFSLVMQQRFDARQAGLAGVLSQSADKRLIPALLEFCPRAAKGMGLNSPGYRAATAALEQLLQSVTPAEISAWPEKDRDRLLPFLEGTLEPQITIQVLRLIVDYGDARTLAFVDSLASQHEWGGSVEPELCERLHDSAVACAAALRKTIDTGQRH